MAERPLLMLSFRYQTAIPLPCVSLSIPSLWLSLYMTISATPCPVIIIKPTHFPRQVATILSSPGDQDERAKSTP